MLDSGKPTFEEIYRRYSQEIGRLCLMRVRNEEEARDLTHQIFEQALHAFPRYEERGFARAWLYQIARNVLNNRERNFRATVQLEEVSASMAEARPDLDEQALTNLEVDILIEEIALLPPIQRMVLELWVIGTKGPQIAEALSIPYSMVRTNLRYGLNRLHSALRARENGHAA